MRVWPHKARAWRPELGSKLAKLSDAPVNVTTPDLQFLLHHRLDETANLTTHRFLKRVEPIVTGKWNQSLGWCNIARGVSSFRWPETAALKVSTTRSLYQISLIMTHRDGFPRLSARSAWRGDAGHRKPCAPSETYGPSESLGKPPFRSRGRTAGGRRKALTTRPPQQRRCRCGGWMSRRTCGFPPTRRIACPISMGHYQRSLV